MGTTGVLALNLSEIAFEGENAPLKFNFCCYVILVKGVLCTNNLQVSTDFTNVVKCSSYFIRCIRLFSGTFSLHLFAFNMYSILAVFNKCSQCNFSPLLTDNGLAFSK